MSGCAPRTWSSRRSGTSRPSWTSCAPASKPWRQSLPKEKRPERNGHHSLIAALPKAYLRDMRAVALVATDEGVEVIGLCCDTCTWALLAHVWESRPTP